MENENEIKEGKIKLNSFKVELVLFLILGFLLGVMIKTEAVKRITIGFNDYKVQAASQDYDINQMEEDLIEAQKEEAEEQQEQQDENQESAQEEAPAGACGV